MNPVKRLKLRFGRLRLRHGWIVKRFNAWNMALWTLVASTIVALWIAFPTKDAPAWWQAILSGVGVIIAVLIGGSEKRHQEIRERERLSSLLLIVMRSVQEIATIARTLADRDDTWVSDKFVRDRVKHLDHRLQHLQLFSPYDRLGDFSLVSAIADVEVCCRNVVTYLDEPTLPVHQVAEEAGILTQRCARALKSLITFL